MNAVPRFNRDRPAADRWHVKRVDGRWVAETPKGHSIPFDSLGVALDYAHERVRLARMLHKAADDAAASIERAREHLIGAQARRPEYALRP